MSSERARAARRLAGMLTAASGVHVILSYRRELRHYHVVWTRGPQEREMRALVDRYAGQVPVLDVTGLRWSRRG